jgi:hypothetical protein
MNKTKKLMAGISATALLIGISGCGPNQQAAPDRDWQPDDQDSGNEDWSAGNDEIPPVPEGTDCSDWNWDEEDGVWECNDTRSTYFGHYFFAGMFFSNRSMLYRSGEYRKYRDSPSFKGARLDSRYKNTSPKGSSGFGSGSRATTGG